MDFLKKVHPRCIFLRTSRFPCAPTVEQFRDHGVALCPATVRGTETDSTEQPTITELVQFFAVNGLVRENIKQLSCHIRSWGSCHASNCNYTTLGDQALIELLTCFHRVQTECPNIRQRSARRNSYE